MELRFRAWVKEMKEMIPVDTIYFKTKVICSGGLWRFFDEVELMQDTGINDVRGNRIYIGDIVEAGYDGFSQFYEVVFNQKSCSCELHHKDEHKRLTKNNVGKLKIEIFGNIYQHSHLLENCYW